MFCLILIILKKYGKNISLPNNSRVEKARRKEFVMDRMISVLVSLIESPNGPLVRQEVSRELGLKCSHRNEIAGAVGGSPPPCGRGATVRFIMDDHSSLACDDKEHNGEVDHQDLARQEVVQAFFDQKLGSPSHAPQL